MKTWRLAAILCLIAGLTVSCGENEIISNNNTSSKQNTEQPKDPENPDPIKDPEQETPSQCTPAPDEDGDTISDADEGRNEKRDTDADTIPDYLDDDSDGDTIPDAVEAGTNGCSANEPDDADFDEIPNYIDLDSDDNGIPDADEVGPDPKHPIDTDNDTIPDYLDDDNDGDGIYDTVEILGERIFDADNIDETQFSGDCNGDTLPDKMGSPQVPIDCDSDTVPDYMDKDSDGDTIPDIIESNVNNGIFYARYSKDSDSNGIPDDEECSGTIDADGFLTNCIDLDGDTVPDFLDLDNDGDGLTDIYEKSIGSDMNKLDSDDDGVPDYVEIALNTDLNDPNDNPQAHGDFFFIVPYQGETTPKKQSLSFATSIQTIDIYFSVDQSGSMVGEIETLSKKIPSMLETMRCKDLGRECLENKDCADLNDGKAICSVENRCIVDPDIGSDGNGCFVNMWSGYGGWGNLDNFENRVSIQEDPNKVANAITRKDVGGLENAIQPPAIIAEGTKHCTGHNNKCSKVNCVEDSSRIGCVGYRREAIKVLIHAGDEQNSEFQNGDTKYNDKYVLANASIPGKALRDNNIRFIGLWGSKDARDKWAKQIACEAGSCAAGENCAKDCQNISSDELKNLFLAPINDGSIETETVSLVRKLAKNMKLNITSGASDLDIKDVSKLVAELRVNITDEEVDGRICTKVSNIVSGQFEGIQKLAPGTSVCYDVIPVDHQSIFPPKPEPQLLKAKIEVMGDGSVLNSGIAYFVVPPVPGQEQIN